MTMQQWIDEMYANISLRLRGLILDTAIVVSICAALLVVRIIGM